MIQPCFQGWADKDHNDDGRCCCNCEYQQPIVAHPWNENPYVKGPCSDIIGWGCHGRDLFPYVTFSDREHSMCEMHKFREWKMPEGYTPRVKGADDNRD